MTPKEYTLQRLYQARTAHVRWVNGIKLLVSGIDVPDSAISLIPADSDFGKWFYDEAFRFSLGMSQMVLDDIETLFLSMHDRYTKIYPIYYAPKKKALFGALLGNRSRASDAETEFSLRHYEEIVSLSDKLKHKLRVFESQLQSMEEERFKHVAMQSIPQETAGETAPVPENPTFTDSDQSYFYGARGRG
jgi:hypothetical protein